MGYLENLGFDEHGMLLATQRSAKCRANIGGLATMCGTGQDGVGLSLPDANGRFTNENMAVFRPGRLDLANTPGKPNKMINVEYHTRQKHMVLGTVVLMGAEAENLDQPIRYVGPTGQHEATASAFETPGKIDVPDVRFRMALHMIEDIVLPPVRR